MSAKVLLLFVTGIKECCKLFLICCKFGLLMICAQMKYGSSPKFGEEPYYRTV